MIKIKEDCLAMFSEKASLAILIEPLTRLVKGKSVVTAILRIPLESSGNEALASKPHLQVTEVPIDSTALQ